MCWPSSPLHKTLEGLALVLSPLSCSPVHLSLSGAIRVQVCKPQLSGFCFFIYSGCLFYFYALNIFLFYILFCYYILQKNI